MTTFEIRGSTREQRLKLRENPLIEFVEVLDKDYTNVSCNDIDAVKLEDLLETLNLEYRLI